MLTDYYKILLIIAVTFVSFVSCDNNKSFFKIEDDQFNIDTQLVSKLDFYVPEYGSFTVNLTDSGWVTFEKGSNEVYPADIRYLGFFLGEFVNKRIQRVIQNPTNIETFGFGDDKAIVIDFYDFDVNLGRLTLGYVDDQSSIALSTLTRIDSNPNILSINNLALSYFNRGLINWRDKSILRIPRDSLSSVTYVQNSDSVVFNRVGPNDWRWGHNKINYATYNRLELALSTLNAIDFQQYDSVENHEFAMKVKKVSGESIVLDFYRESDFYVVCTEYIANECFNLTFNYVLENLNREDKTSNIRQ
jgi:hypothetical protein